MSKNKLYSKTLKINDISSEDRQAMFDVFSNYYDNVSRETFEKDLEAKDVVFLLLDQREDRIRGFSTLVSLNYKKENGDNVRGLFSGDTIVEKEFWGQGTLGVAFLKYLFMQKLQNPFKPLYWFLISKGFKTYLLMANNFSNQSPRYENVTLGISKILSTHLVLNSMGNIIRVNSDLLSLRKLREKTLLNWVSLRSLKMMIENPRIAYFSEKNPAWEHGDELCCLAEMTLSMPFKYQAKIINKQFSKSLAKGGQSVCAFGLGYDERRLK